MLTSDQIRLRLEQIPACVDPACSCWQITALLREILPELVTLASGRSHADADAGRRYGAVVGQD